MTVCVVLRVGLLFFITAVELRMRVERAVLFTKKYFGEGEGWGGVV